MPQKTVRPPTGKGVQIPTDRPPMISCGKKERRMLGVLLNSRGTRFNIREYSRRESVSRSTVYDIINRLCDKGLVIKLNMGNYEISKKGMQFLDVLEDVQNPRRGCRARDNLSMHYQRYFLVCEKMPQVSKGILLNLKSESVTYNDLPNQRIWYVKFSDATVVISNKRVVLRVGNVMAEDICEALIDSMSLVVSYVKQLEEIGFVISGVRLDDAHYARVSSVFAEVLSEIDSHYYIELGGGRKFWIDNSKGKREDETNYIELRERLDEFIKDLPESRSVLSDVDKLKEAVADLFAVVCKKGE